MTDQSVVMAAEPQTFAGSLRGFAAFMRSGAFDDGDVEMVAKKFEAAADEIERLRKVETAARALKFGGYPAHGSGLVLIVTEGNVDDLAVALDPTNI